MVSAKIFARNSNKNLAQIDGIYQSRLRDVEIVNPRWLKFTHSSSAARNPVDDFIRSKLYDRVTVLNNVQRPAKLIFKSKNLLSIKTKLLL